MTHRHHSQLATATSPESHTGLASNGGYEAYSHVRGDAARAEDAELDGPAAYTHGGHTSQWISHAAAETQPHVHPHQPRPFERVGNTETSARTGAQTFDREVYEEGSPSSRTQVPAANAHQEHPSAARVSPTLSELRTDLEHHLRVAPESVGRSLQRLLSHHQISTVPDHYADSYDRLAVESVHLRDTISRLERNAVRTAARGKSELDLARTDSEALARRCEDLEDSLTSAHEIMAEYFAQVSPHAQSLLDGGDGQSEWKRQLDDFLARKGYRTGARTGVTDSCSVLSQEINND